MQRIIVRNSTHKSDYQDKMCQSCENYKKIRDISDNSKNFDGNTRKEIQ